MLQRVYIIKTHISKAIDECYIMNENINCKVPKIDKIMANSVAFYVN